MRAVERLITGYRSFRHQGYAAQAERYRALAEQGQAPEVMIIACCDSRADPALIFDAAPGEFFIVRNVANLVPPFEPMGDYHGTSAALEFAVTGLEVRHVCVLGHARCGGIKACLDGAYANEDGAGYFVSKWMSLAKGARGEVIRSHRNAPEEERLKALEQAAIRTSIDNLKTFPFVREAVAAGRLTLHGGYFDISTGDLLGLNGGTGEFEPLPGEFQESRSPDHT